MRSEKVTINLSIAELGQIDYLVSKGIYASRSDYIRLAVRKQTERHAHDFNDFFEPPYLKSDTAAPQVFGGIGIIYLRLSDVEYLINIKRKIRIRVLGLLIIDEAVNADIIKEAVDESMIYGKVIADKSVKDALSIKKPNIPKR